ncbi:MAG TPA: hypothetical protein VGJ48_22570 [Pyrinomonadaceae bacterium]|jgi:hypothetical protein
MTWQQTRGFLAFFLFLLLAAPIEFNLALYFGEAQRALIGGVLYFFAIIVAIESLMRLVNHPEIAGRPLVFFLKCFLLIPVVLFAIDFMPKRFGGNPTAMGQWQYQERAALFAALGAVITQIVLEATNSTLRRMKGN